MKRLLCCFLVFLFKIVPIDAQNAPYSPMAVEGAHWFYEEQEAGVPFVHARFSLTIKGDTIFDGKKYKKLYRENFYFDKSNFSFPKPYQIVFKQLQGLIRDDSMQRKVFYIGKTNYGVCAENLPDEYILYDFSNIKINDTLPWCMFKGLGGKTIVKGTETKVLYEKNRFIFDFQVGNYPMAKIGEGIGVLVMGGIFYIHPFEQQRWFTKYCLGTEEQCGLVTVATKEMNKKPTLMHFKVNQDNNFILPYQSINNSLEKYTLTIYDINGKHLQQLQINNLEDIENVDITNSGFYMAVLMQNNVIIGSAKIYLNYFPARATSSTNTH
jgi:hypothetical protein